MRLTRTNTRGGASRSYIGAASPDEVIFTRGTTESINLVAQAWGGKFIREGDVILLTVMEHHSNLVPWQLLAERKGARLRFLPVRDDGTLDVDQLSSLLTPEVKLFAFTHISNSLGTINPVAELCAKARAVGALTLVDAAQSMRATCRSMCRNWAAISLRSQDTRCVDRLELACFTDARSFWIPCRRGTAEAK